MKASMVRHSCDCVVVCAAVAVAVHFASTSPAAGDSGTAPLAPRVVDPGPPGGPPSDAMVLFDGKDLSRWKSARGGGDARWTVENGEMVVNGTGDLHSRDEFGDVQLHVEWAVPEGGGKGESRGNSGIKLRTRYEIQILDNYEHQSSPKGQAGAVYKQHAPLVNACRRPGEWQVYDIIFRAPRFNKDGERIKHGRFTVFHNGVLVQDNVKIHGPTNSNRPATPRYKKPILLQDHGSAVRYRNIWVRELPPRSDD